MNYVAKIRIVPYLGKYERVMVNVVDHVSKKIVTVKKKIKSILVSHTLTMYTTNTLLNC